LQQVTTNGNTSNVGISVTAGGVSTNSLTDTALTLGSVPFTGAGGLISQDNANFFWDDTNNRLGINTNTPGNSLDVHSSGTNPILALNNTAGNQSAISFLNTSVAKWRIGNTSTNTFDIFNFGLNNHAIRINSGDNSIEITNDIFVLSNGSLIGSNANGTTPLRIQCNNINKAIQFLNPATGTADFYVSGTSTSTAYRFSTYSTVDSFVIENNGDTKTKSISYAEEFILNSATYGILAALTRNLIAPGIGILQLKNSAFAYIQPTTLTVDRTYTLPDATGTIALTSNLSAYLPLTGGTLTGNLTISTTDPSFATTDTTNSSFFGLASTINAYISGSLVGDAIVRGASGICFSANGGTSTNLRISSAGNIGINTTTFGVDQCRIAAASATNVNLGLISTDDASGATFISFRNSAGSSIGNVSRVLATNAVAYNTTSDKRLKNDLGIADTNIIDNVIIHDFQWLQDGTIDKGVFAQELYKIKPLAVNVGNDELNESKELQNPWGVDYSKLIPDLIVYCQDLKNTIQQQQFIINGLLQRIELLENK
jgi:hypothetical protein